MNDVVVLLQEFYRDTLARLVRHEESARAIRQYDANNTYQYIINREETHLSWLGSAIAALGATVPDAVEPSASSQREDGATAVLEDDAGDAQRFVDRWRPRVEAMPNARHARMLKVILGEVLEQKRFFEQARAGRTDLLGRRSERLEPSAGEVLPTRWIE